MLEIYLIIFYIYKNIFLLLYMENKKYIVILDPDKVKAQSKKYYELNKSKISEQRKNKQITEEQKEKNNIYMREWRKLHPKTPEQRAKHAEYIATKRKNNPLTEEQKIINREKSLKYYYNKKNDIK